MINKHRDYANELSYWSDIMICKDPWIPHILNPNFIFNKELEDVCISHFDNESSLKICDVGCGPVSSVGYKSNFFTINIIGVDPLIIEYNKLLKEHNYTRPFISIAYDAEKLIEIFGENIFDVVHSRNSLDHTEDPISAIQNCYGICKKNGLLFFRFMNNEANNAGFTGLHQWNFTNIDSDIRISNNKNDVYSLKEILNIENINISIQELLIKDKSTEEIIVYFIKQ